MHVVRVSRHLLGLRDTVAIRDLLNWRHHFNIVFNSLELGSQLFVLALVLMKSITSVNIGHASIFPLFVTHAVNQIAVFTYEP